MSLHNLISFAGLWVLLGLAWVLSHDRKVINARAVGWGVGLQIAMAAIIFLVPQSKVVLAWANDALLELLEAGSEGIRFAFGAAAQPPGAEGSLGFILVIQGLLLCVFFGALMSLLYYIRVMEKLIYAFSRVFTRLMRISGAESLCVSANIFVGIEAYLTIRPYLQRMTRSELFTILTAGMTTIASTVLGLYVLFLKDQIPNIAGHLMSASLISAPAAIVISKIMWPETEQPDTMGKKVQLEEEGRPASFIEAIINGATQGMTMAINITALLIAFIGLTALLNLLLALFGVTLQDLLAYLFYPIAIVLGIPLEDALPAAKLLGERLVLTEVPAYQKLASLTADGSLSARTAMILSYALCGFAHIPAVAIFVGGAMTIAPERKHALATLGFRALLAATLACCMTGAAAGLFYH